MKYKITLKIYYSMLAILLVGMFISSASAATATYTYDKLNRLTSVSYDNGNSITYTYDAAGNITRVDKVSDSAAVDAPTAITHAADNITSKTATLHGFVKSNTADTVVIFQYGTTTDYGLSINAESDLVNGASDTSVSASLFDMRPSTTYHFRLVVTAGEGTSYGEDHSFTTLPINNEMDIDQDGVLDEWEIRNYGSIINDRDDYANMDTDGDGYSDLEEYLNGTDITIPDNIMGEILCLTDNYPYTLKAGSYTKVYGTAGANNIVIESGAKAKLLHFPGHNTITIKADSNIFSVSRSGAYVSFKGSDGTILEMPATSTPQRISFNDIELILIIKNNQVMLADQVVDLTPSEIEFSTNYPSNPSIIGFVETPDSAHSVTIVDQIAYLADGDSGLQVIDVSDPSNPSIIGSVETPGYAHSVTVVDQTAYLADGESGLQVIDVSNPLHPVIIGGIDIPTYVTTLAINGNLVYIGGSSDKNLWVIDVSNPSIPVIVSDIDLTGQVGHIAVNENMLYVANPYYYKGLQIIEIKTPFNPDPFIVSSIETPGLAYDVSVNGNIAYVADAFDGLQVIDITNPYNPYIIANIDSEFATDVEVTGDIAYMVIPDSDDNSSYVKIIDVSDPGNPLEINSIEISVCASDIAIDKNTAYVTDYHHGLSIISIP